MEDDHSDSSSDEGTHQEADLGDGIYHNEEEYLKLRGKRKANEASGDTSLDALPGFVEGSSSNADNGAAANSAMDFVERVGAPSRATKKKVRSYSLFHMKAAYEMFDRLRLEEPDFTEIEHRRCVGEAQDINVRTFSEWLKNRAEIEAKLAVADEKELHRLRGKQNSLFPFYHKEELILRDLLIGMKERGERYNCDWIRAKMLQLVEESGAKENNKRQKEFTASPRWVTRYLRRHGLTGKNNGGTLSEKRRLQRLQSEGLAPEEVVPLPEFSVVLKPIGTEHELKQYVRKKTTTPRPKKKKADPAVMWEEEQQRKNNIAISASVGGGGGGGVSSSSAIREFDPSLGNVDSDSDTESLHIGSSSLHEIIPQQQQQVASIPAVVIPAAVPIPAVEAVEPVIIAVPAVPVVVESASSSSSSADVAPVHVDQLLPVIAPAPAAVPVAESGDTSTVTAAAAVAAAVGKKRGRPPGAGKAVASALVTDAASSAMEGAAVVEKKAGAKRGKYATKGAVVAAAPAVETAAEV